MTEAVAIGKLQVARVLRDFIEQEALPGTGLDAARFWQALQTCLAEFAPRNRALLARRDALQAQIDTWHRDHPGPPEPAAYRQFLSDIGYLEDEGPDFPIRTTGLDPEISQLSGPQLVVPVMNARYALNAANARWGSLYDALYGSDVIPETGGAETGPRYNPRRGEKVVAFAEQQLDQIFPLQDARHAEVTAWQLEDGQLRCQLADDRLSGLAEPAQLAGYRGRADDPDCILLQNHGLHVELQFDRQHPVGARHPAGLKDILLEAALTTIQDCEDSVAAVDADDKVQVYRNWLGLMQGDLSATFRKGDRTLTRELDPDRDYLAPDGEPFRLPGRSLLLNRNVGLLTSNDMVCDADGNAMPEGILDGMITSLIGLHDLRGNGRYRNSRAGSIYLVKPKLHGPAEVAFTVELFAHIETALGLPANTLKLGMMDEERRTSLNLKECIRAARERIFFINTGFLDRTGDEIHTSMEAGPMVGKGDMKSRPWLQAYEDHNVDTGLACGFRGRAQIGKGMWAMPDEMRRMLEEKIDHPRAGANTAWVPSPTAAVLHALHYHQVDVRAVQAERERRPTTRREAMLQIPLLGAARPEAAAIQAELDNNTQGILGYVVRWVEQGVGCSRVPDIHDIGLMEDRATLRISSQHIANWLHHGLCTEAQVRQTLEKMAVKVDRQNANDPRYRKMAPDLEHSLAFRAACDLIFKGRAQPNGYTEPLLYRYRRQAKQSR